MRLFFAIDRYRGNRRGYFVLDSDDTLFTDQSGEIYGLQRFGDQWLKSLLLLAEKELLDGEDDVLVAVQVADWEAVVFHFDALQQNHLLEDEARL